jgi:hypothetical protein
MKKEILINLLSGVISLFIMGLFIYFLISTVSTIYN